MKRFAASAGMIVLAALSLAAAVWDGSAVAGVAGDFPGDGLYGACNSFPKDTSVKVTNLENGKSVTVTVTNGVDNPGVFIALSPKAATELGMRAGAAARIRAFAITASQAETSLPPTRAGETADPDFNPKVYVEREKAAVKAAAAAAAPAPAATAAAAAPVAGTAAPVAAQTLSPTAKTPESAEVLAKVAEPRKKPVAGLPTMTEPKPAAPKTAVAATPAAKPEPTSVSGTAPVAVQPVTPAAKTPETAEVLAKVTEPRKEPAAALPTMTEPNPASPKAVAAVTPAVKPEPTPAAGTIKPTQPVSPAAKKPETAEVLAKVAEPRKEPTVALPAMTEPNPASPKAVAAVTPAAKPEPIPEALPKTAVTNIPADALPLPEASFVFPGSPKPGPLGMSLPTPDPLSIPKTSGPKPRGGYLAVAPDIYGGSIPKPRKPATPRVAISDPALPGSAQAKVTVIEKATVDALNRPGAVSPSSAISLGEPKIAPDVIPEAILNRIIAPSKVVPMPVLAEIETPKEAVSMVGLEAIALERPSYTDQIEAAVLAEASTVSPSEVNAVLRPGQVGGEKTSAELAEAELPGSPEALGDSPDAPTHRVATASLDEAVPPGGPESLGGTKPVKAEGYSATASLDEAVLPGTPDALADRTKAGEGSPLSELPVPDIPRPSDSLSADRPADRTLGLAADASLAEPSAPAVTPSGPTAIADSRPGPGQPPTAELGEPEVPAPGESLVAGKPNAVEPGQTIAELAEPVTTIPGAFETATSVEKPALAVSPTAELASPDVPNPLENIAVEKPVLPPAGEQMVTLEPAAPRPPQTGATGAVVPGVEPKPTPPAAVATVKGSSPAGAVQPPASIPILKGLAKGSFYVQIGVYGTNDSLRSAIGGFKATYPLAVESLTTKKGSPAYRLFVGPLTRDESGTVLFKIRALGYKDAYVRQGS